MYYSDGYVVANFELWNISTKISYHCFSGVGDLFGKNIYYDS
jgi:hypothetical protein